MPASSGHSSPLLGFASFGTFSPCLYYNTPHLLHDDKIQGHDGWPNKRKGHCRKDWNQWIRGCDAVSFQNLLADWNSAVDLPHNHSQSTPFPETARTLLAGKHFFISRNLKLAPRSTVFLTWPSFKRSTYSIPSSSSPWLPTSSMSSSSTSRPGNRFGQQKFLLT